MEIIIENNGSHISHLEEGTKYRQLQRDITRFFPLLCDSRKGKTLTSVSIDYDSFQGPDHPDGSYVNEHENLVILPKQFQSLQYDFTATIEYPEDSCEPLREKLVALFYDSINIRQFPLRGVHAKIIYCSKKARADLTAFGPNYEGTPGLSVFLVFDHQNYSEFLDSLIKKIRNEHFEMDSSLMTVPIGEEVAASADYETVMRIAKIPHITGTQSFEKLVIAKFSEHTLAMASNCFWHVFPEKINYDFFYKDFQVTVAKHLCLSLKRPYSIFYLEDHEKLLRVFSRGQCLKIINISWIRNTIKDLSDQEVVKFDICKLKSDVDWNLICIFITWLIWAEGACIIPNS